MYDVIELVHVIPAIENEGSIVEPEVITIAAKEKTYPLDLEDSDRAQLENEYRADLLRVVAERRNANPQSYTPYDPNGYWTVRTEITE